MLREEYELVDGVQVTLRKPFALFEFPYSKPFPSLVVYNLEYSGYCEEEYFDEPAVMYQAPVRTPKPESDHHKDCYDPYCEHCDLCDYGGPDLPLPRPRFMVDFKYWAYDLSNCKQMDVSLSEFVLGNTDELKIYYEDEYQCSCQLELPKLFKKFSLPTDTLDARFVDFANILDPDPAYDEQEHSYNLLGFTEILMMHINEEGQVATTKFDFANHQDDESGDVSYHGSGRLIRYIENRLGKAQLLTYL